MENIFRNIFEDSQDDGEDGFRAKKEPQRQRPISRHPLPVTLEQLFLGCKKKLKVNRKRPCRSCRGKGGRANSAMEKCPSCHGSGVKLTYQQLGMGIAEMHSNCPECAASGVVVAVKDRCSSCEGKRTKHEAITLEVRVDSGMGTGSEILLPGEGDQEVGEDPGDILIIVHQKDHELFKRKGAHLFTEVQITLTEALCGFKRFIRHLDGRSLAFISPPGVVVHPGDQKLIQSEGFPMLHNPYERGSLIIRFKVEMPTEMNPTAISELEELLGGRPDEKSVQDADVEEVNLLTWDRPFATPEDKERLEEDAEFSERSVGCQQS